MTNKIDLQTQSAANAFKVKLAHHFDVQETLLFGNRARQTQHAEEARRAVSQSQCCCGFVLKSGDFDGACNRAYYAMFDAARAVFK